MPALVALLQRPEVSIRTGAVYALRQLRSNQSVPALIAALDDPDEMIRYHAMFALAYQTDRMNPQWAWGLDRFRQKPKELIGKWKGWWEQEGSDQYPSLEAVLNEYEQTKETLGMERKTVPLPTSEITPEAPPVVLAPSRQSSMKPKTRWFRGNQLLVIVSGLCLATGLCLYFGASSRRCINATHHDKQ